MFSVGVSPEIGGGGTGDSSSFPPPQEAKNDKNMNKNKIFNLIATSNVILYIKIYYFTEKG
jgi:hypothetical protein